MKLHTTVLFYLIMHYVFGSTLTKTQKSSKTPQTVSDSDGLHSNMAKTHTHTFRDSHC